MYDVTIGNGVDGLRKHAFSAKFQKLSGSGGQTGQAGGQTGLMVTGGLTGP